MKDIERETITFIMDYASSLDDCESKIEILIKSGAEIESMLQYMKKMKTYFDISDEDIEQIQKAVNKTYIPSSKVINFRDEVINDITIFVKAQTR